MTPKYDYTQNGTKTFETVNPARPQEVVGRYSWTDETELPAIVERANKAQAIWAKVPGVDRAAKLDAFLDAVVANLDRIAEIVEKLRTQLAADHRAYWICPLVEESDKSDITAAEDRFRHLAKLIPEANPQLVHGRMKADEKAAAMSLFQSGQSKLLVATTVIEVGVDVPEASVIIIEHAERFGLAQLHQLRGRVGRGERQSACLLAYQGPLSETATARLKIMRESNDGFRLAEEDLKLRGPGEILGQRQSGMPEFTLVDLAAHGDLIPIARKMADTVTSQDPDLSKPESEPYRLLLSLFEKDNAVQFLNSG